MKHRDATHMTVNTHTQVKHKQCSHINKACVPIHLQKYTQLTQAHSLTHKYVHIYLSSASIPMKLVCGLYANFKK